MHRDVISSLLMKYWWWYAQELFMSTSRRLGFETKKMQKRCHDNKIWKWKRFEFTINTIFNCSLSRQWTSTEISATHIKYSLKLADSTIPHNLTLRNSIVIIRHISISSSNHHSSLGSINYCYCGVNVKATQCQHPACSGHYAYTIFSRILTTLALWNASNKQYRNIGFSRFDKFVVFMNNWSNTMIHMYSNLRDLLFSTL